MPNNGELLWSMRGADNRLIECRIDFSEGGVVVRILSDGPQLMRRLFPTGTEALAWAEEEREAHEPGNIASGNVATEHRTTLPDGEIS